MNEHLNIPRFQPPDLEPSKEEDSVPSDVFWIQRRRQGFKYKCVKCGKLGKYINMPCEKCGSVMEKW